MTQNRDVVYTLKTNSTVEPVSKMTATHTFKFKPDVRERRLEVLDLFCCKSSRFPPNEHHCSLAFDDVAIKSVVVFDVGKAISLTLFLVPSHPMNSGYPTFDQEHTKF
ncbi:unnamed protein product [Lepeophtheirus salmonis]|uniref:(salmon louse) hypothetical protein n=1 Tax=Lepeophtheirus salmonis TaxID=72036 RepID=A0A7R8CLS7_LEPSM|nr:unnamed protein product [Lepeophtheirus salmonis]CAF2815547.1 unnamed protein product [Lepeophtheirus salmonis]